MTEQEMEKLITKMQGAFATSQDHVNLEDKVDIITELTNTIKEDVATMKVRLYNLPTTDELIDAFHKAYDMATLKKEHDRMKKIILDHLHVEV